MVSFWCREDEIIVYIILCCHEIILIVTDDVCIVVDYVIDLFNCIGRRDNIVGSFSAQERFERRILSVTSDTQTGCGTL